MFNLPALRKKSAELSPFLLTSFTHIRYKIYTSGKVLAPFLPWRADYGPGVVAPRAPKKRGRRCNPTRSASRAYAGNCPYAQARPGNTYRGMTRVSDKFYADN